VELSVQPEVPELGPQIADVDQVKLEVFLDIGGDFLPSCVEGAIEPVWTTEDMLIIPCESTDVMIDSRMGILMSHSACLFELSSEIFCWERRV
jgi:hypothetical protein